MPELPEVETVVRDLRPLLVGRRLLHVETSKQSLRRAWNPKWNDSLKGRTVKTMDRRGKWIQIHLDDTSLLIIHLGMTGQLTVHPRQETFADHVHLWFDLDQKEEQLRFRDIRRFGSADYYPSATTWENKRDEKLGPEPFDLTKSYFREAVSKCRRNMKAILLDQSIVAGIGNIYADESLFRSGIHPACLGSSLTSVQIETLRQAIVEILTIAIESRGATIRNYVGGSGLQGGYQDSFFVYGRADLECLNCKTPIEVLRLAGRSSHYCPKCQQKPE